MLSYHKALLFVSIIFCSFQIHAQGYPNLNDIYTFALCKDSSSFKKEALKKSFHYLRTVKSPSTKDYYVEFLSNKMEANGTYNILAWIFQFKNEGSTHYVSYGTTNLDAFTALMDKMDESGFVKVHDQMKDDENDNLVLTSFYKFKDTGISSTISQKATKKGMVEFYRFACKKPISTKWPFEK